MAAAGIAGRVLIEPWVSFNGEKVWMIKRRTDVASRHIEAAPADIYAALVDRAAVEQWLPPAGSRGEIHAFEPRVAGAFRMTLHFEAGVVGKTTADSDEVKARFVKLEPDRCVQQDVEFVAEDPKFAGTMRMTWMLKPDDQGTLVEIIAEDVPPGISAKDHQLGLRSSLDQVAAYAEARASKKRPG